MFNAGRDRACRVKYCKATGAGFPSIVHAVTNDETIEYTSTSFVSL